MRTVRGELVWSESDAVHEGSCRLRLGIVVSAAALAQTTLRVGLAEDPDNLDPTIAGSYVGRIVLVTVPTSILLRADEVVE
jgi:hypothetical protein